MVDKYTHSNLRGMPMLINNVDEQPMPIISIVPTVSWHIGVLKENLRPEDASEIMNFGITIKHALWQSYRHSLISRTGLIDGAIAACWGLQGIFMGKTGVPWLMTAPEVYNISPLRFARIYQQQVLEMLKIFPRLENYVDSEYSAAIRLLEIVGFTIEEPKKRGLGMYHKFWIEA